MQINEMIQAQVIQPKADPNAVITSKAHDKQAADLYKEFQRQAYLWSQKSGRAFVVDNENREAIKLLVLYFSGHPEFLKQKLYKSEIPSHKKSVIICGNVGSGKTLLLQLFNQCFEKGSQFITVPCDVATDKWRKLGGEAFEQWYKVKRKDNQPNEMCFDDLGVESKAKYFGDAINPMYDIILKRYRLYTDHGLRTHMTTNLGPDVWAEYYDDRTESRLVEMSNIIILGKKQTSIDRRKLT